MSNLLDAKSAHSRLCQSLIALRKAEGNKVPWTKARQVVKIATPDTEKRWIEMAGKKSREQILLMALEAMLCGNEDPSRRDSSNGGSSTRVDAGTPYQVVAYQCEACKVKAVGPKRSALSAADTAAARGAAAPRTFWKCIT